MSEFGERLREARLNKGMSQVELANAMGITQASISQFEKGDRLPTPEHINQFVDILETSREYLAGDNQGNFEKSLLERTIKGLSPKTLKKLIEYAQLLKLREYSK